MAGRESAADEEPQPGAWTVALACSWINLFVFAVFRSAGVLYMALVRTFGCSHAEAAWPITLASAVASITCLPAGFLSHYFAVRTIVSCGILITSFSIAICFFTNSITSIILSLGTTQGIGIGFITGLLPVIISDYFGRRSAAACGLSYAGAGVGAFFFPIVFQYLLDEFGLRGSLLIMGALVLHAISGALLLSPPSPPVLFHQPDAGTGAHGREIRRKSVLRATKSGEDVADWNPEGSAGVENDLSGGAGYGLGGDCSDTASGQGSRMCPSSRRDRRSERRRPSLPALDSREQERALLHESGSPEDVPDNGSPGERKDEQTVVDCEGTQQQPRPSFSKQIFARMAQDAQLLRQRHFFLITLTYVSYILGSVTLLMILPDYVVNVGQERSTGVLLLSFFSVTDLLGRLLPGWISCLPFSNKSLYILSIGSMGILFFLFPIIVSRIDSDYAGIVLICLTLCCGFVSGCQMILPPVLAAELLGQKNTAMAFAMSNFICGFFSFSRPFIFRRLVDTSSSSSSGRSRYDKVFYIFGSFALISCLAWIVEAIICHQRLKKKDSLTIK